MNVLSYEGPPVGNSSCSCRTDVSLAFLLLPFGSTDGLATISMTTKRQQLADVGLMCRRVSP